MSGAEFHTQNAHVPIFKLPDEILESVFLGSNSEYRSARQISQVCIRWRIVALSISRLWNVIRLSSHHGVSRWSHELLRRSANSPYIMIPFATRDSLDNLLTAQPNIIPRICLLFIDAISDSTWNKLLTSGIQLREIRLIDRHADDYPQMVSLPRNGPPVQVFKQARGEVDRLCSSFPFLAHLVRLSLSDTTCTILQFALMVEHMPSLEDLHFLGEPFVFLPQGIQPPAISMPHLRFLYTDILCLLDHVTVSPECVLRIASDPFIQYNDSVVTRVANRFIMDYTKNGNSYLTIYTTSRSVIIGNQRSSYARDQHILNPKPHDQLELYNTTRQSNFRKRWFPVVLRIISRISSILPTVIDLSLILEKESQLRELKPYFRHMSSLKSLNFHLSGSVSNFAPLRAIHDKYGGGILFPSLETLFTHKEFDPTDKNSLELYLRWRIEHGKPIKYIKGQY